MTENRSNASQGIVTTTRLGNGTVWRVLQYPQGLRVVHRWFLYDIHQPFQYILENQDGGRRLVVHEPEKMAVLARFCEAFRALLVSVRDGAIQEAHHKSVQRDPSRLSMQMQLSLPVIAAIDQFSCRCRAQQHRLALNQELRGSSTAKLELIKGGAAALRARLLQVEA